MKAGRTYLVQVADAQGGYDSSGADGPAWQGRPVTLSVTGTGRLLSAPRVNTPLVQSTANLDKETGTVILKGSLTCTGDLITTAELKGTVVQSRQKLTVSAPVAVSLPQLRCDGTPQDWSTTVRPTSAKFALGSVKYVVTASVTNAIATVASPPARGTTKAVVQRS